MNKNIVLQGYTIIAGIAISSLLTGCGSAPGLNVVNPLTQAAAPAGDAAAEPAGPQGSATEVTYKNKQRNFAFTIPAGWSQQSGDPNSDDVIFMKVPISESCSFQYHYTPMQASFPAETSVNASLKTAKADIKAGKLLSAKRRDESGKLNGKSVRLTRGWEVVEKGTPGNHQRIIYQAYDKDNYYFNFMAAAASPEQFTKCEPELRKAIDSIKFGD